MGFYKLPLCLAFYVLRARDQSALPREKQPLIPSLICHPIISHTGILRTEVELDSPPLSMARFGFEIENIFFFFFPRYGILPLFQWIPIFLGGWRI